MEKAKAYIKNELRGGSMSLQSEPTSTPPPVPQGNNQLMMAAAELMPSPLGGYHTHQYYPTPLKSAGRASAPPEHMTASISVCFVCGGYGSYEALRVRANPERPGEPHFPFLERHEPPQGVPAVAASQVYVMACMLCFRSLHEQWESYERQKKPLLQRIYHMKRVDGKGYIGADVATQSEYAAQMLGLSAEHLSQNGLAELHNAAAAPPMDPYALSRHYAVGMPASASPQLPQHHSTSRTASPDYYPRNATPTSHSQSHGNHKYLSRPQSRDMQLPSPLSRPPSEPPARMPPNSSSSSSFAQHKFKLGQLSFQAAACQAQAQPQSQSSAQYQPAQYQQLQQQTAAYHMLQQVAAGSSSDPQAHYKGNPYSALPNVGTAMPLTTQPPSLEDDNATVLDLRNSATVNSIPAVASAPVATPTPRSQPGSSSSSTEVGILDLSMPDKNSITEVCYVCGDEQRRGSLVELSTLKPKESRLGQAVAYFPLFNEQHPRPARSRPKDPRGMIQACMPCYEDLMQQWNAHQHVVPIENIP